MKRTAIVRYANCALFGALSLTLIVAPLWLFGIYAGQKGFDLRLLPGVIITVITTAVPAAATLAAIFWSYRRADTGVLFLLWIVVLGNIAPYVPPTIRQVIMYCPPPAISCGIVGSMPWWLLLLCLAG